MYDQQQNKWYPQRCILAHFEATLDFSRSEFTCQVNSLRLNRVYLRNGQINTFGGIIYFAVDGTYVSIFNGQCALNILCTVALSCIQYVSTYRRK